MIEQEQTATAQQVETPTAETDEPKTEIPAMDYGYVVGVKPDGQFVFQTVGNNQGLVQMLGIHQYAGHRLQVATEVNQQYGFPVLAQQVHQLTEMMKVLLNMIGSAGQQQGAAPGNDKRIVTL